MVHSVGRCDSELLANLCCEKYFEEEKSLERIVKYSKSSIHRCKKHDITSIHEKLANLHLKLFAKYQLRNNRNNMNHRVELKNKPIQGYLEILDVDEVELRHPSGGSTGERPSAERPFSLPPNLHLTSTLHEDESESDPVKRDSFLRQSYNTIRKSLRFQKKRRKYKSFSDDPELMTAKTIPSDKNNNNNNKNVQPNKKNHHLIGDDERKMEKKKPNKHLRNSSLGSYFALR